MSKSIALEVGIQPLMFQKQKSLSLKVILFFLQVFHATERSSGGDNPDDLKLPEYALKDVPFPKEGGIAATIVGVGELPREPPNPMLSQPCLSLLVLIIPRWVLLMVSIVSIMFDFVRIGST